MKQILGTMTFGGQVETPDARQILQRFFDAGHRELDTAHSYCDGRTEKLLGELLPGLAREGLYLASKVNPWNDQGLQPRQVKQQFVEILERLGRDSIDLLYLHQPDLETPVEATLEACFELYEQGGFRDFGLSNYASWQVAEVVEICRRHGWMEPRIYQGMYNALTRDVERELFPCLRNYGIGFYAYNPLAGGFLTGKHRSLQDAPDSGRFAPDRGYRDRYWRADYFEVLDDLQAACADSGLRPVEVAMSWLCNHSLLDAAAGDGIILGVSKLDHLTQNMAACERAPLDPAIVDILDRGWEIIKPNCFRYFRP
ncbi:MAG TPA: aldo/keto reductase [Gammaproteobacteria bacterium]|nr:aldo/keto reductase [Gammaproteobacteria bacterium]